MIRQDVHALPSRSLPTARAELEAERAQGAFVFDTDGNRYLDAACGSGSLIFGHGDKELVQIAAEQMARLTVHVSHAFRIEANERYAESLCRFAPPGLTHAMTMSSGSDAVEAALKACLQYHHRRGEGHRRAFIGREGSYHGNSLIGLGVGGFVSRRHPYESILPPWPKAGPARAGCSAEEAVASAADAIERAGAHSVAAIVIEPVVGAAMSGVAPPAGYVDGLRALCDHHGILLIADEVMTGFGRTGLPFASSAWSVSPDIVICGKAIGAGYFPLSAIIVAGEVAKTLTSGGGYFENGQTNCWNPVASAIGHAVIDRLEDGELLSRSGEAGRWLADEVERLLPPEIIGEVRCNGMMIGFDLASGAEQNVSSRAFADAALRAGMIVYPSQGGPATTAGEHVLLLPPLTLTRDEAAHAVRSLSSACAALLEHGPGV